MAQQLERLLAEETRASEEAEAELLVRQDEKAKLRVLLKHKDRRLRQESLCLGRLRRALHNAQSSAGYYMLLCVLHCWRDLSKRRKTHRSLERVKVARQEALLRYSCYTMAVQLRHVLAKPLAAAMNRLWLHSMVASAECQEVKMQSLPVDFKKARKVAAEPVHLGREAFLDLQAAWQRERDEWVAACDKLRCQALVAQGEAEAARHKEAEAVAEAARAMQQAEPIQMQEDRLHLSRLHSELHELINAAKETGELEAKAAKALSDAAIAKSRDPPGELDEVQSLRIELQKARKVAAEPVHLGQEAFLDLQAAWQRERDEWVAACDKLRCQTLVAQGEAEAARRMEAEAVAEAARAMQQAEPIEMQEDRLHLSRLHSELHELINAAKETGELEAKAAKALSDAAIAKSRDPPGELDEVVAYQTLVARLRSELRWERELRRSCDQALETLRGSYGLLLSRASRDEMLIPLTGKKARSPRF